MTESNPLGSSLVGFLESQADERPVVVALSGGLDSIVLLDLVISACPHRLVGAAHFDHAIHPKSSEFCQQLSEQCQTAGLDFFSKRESVADLAKREKISLEAAARQLRYGFLKELATRKDCWILTAHHRDDVGETLLLKLLSGTSLVGLSGPRPRRDDWLLRPLLDISRAQLEEYAAQRKLAWLDDPTNQETQYRRNWVRLQLMPLLRQQNPKIATTLSDLAGEALELESHYHKFKQHLAPESRPTWQLNAIADRLTSETHWPPSFWRTRLAEYWQDFVDHSPGHQDTRISRFHLHEWVRFLQCPGRPDKSLQLPADVQCYWTHKTGFGLRFKSHQNQAAVDSTSWRLEFVDHICQIPQLKLEVHCSPEPQWRPPSPKEISLDATRIADLKIRHRQPGDRWGSEKLKKKLIDWKIPQYQRDSLLLLCRESQILGVIGHRFRVEVEPSSRDQGYCRLRFRSGQRNA
jgi:tRNA(Ile)-lysidine synthase